MSKRSEDAGLLKRKTLDLVETWGSTWSSKDASDVSRFYSHAADLVFFDLDPTHLGWKAYQKSIESSFDSIDDLKLTLNNDLRATVSNVTALTTATGHISYKTKNDESFESNTRFTGVWEKKRGQWRLIHDHWSRSR